MGTVTTLALRAEMEERAGTSGYRSPVTPQQGITPLPVLPVDLVLGLEIIKQMLACFPPQACQAAALMPSDKAQGLQMAPVAVTPSLFLLSRLLLLSNKLDHGARDSSVRNQWDSHWMLRKTCLSQPNKATCPHHVLVKSMLFCCQEESCCLYLMREMSPCPDTQLQMSELLEGKPRTNTLIYLRFGMRPSI